MNDSPLLLSLSHPSFSLCLPFTHKHTSWKKKQSHWAWDCWCCLLYEVGRQHHISHNPTHILWAPLATPGQHKQVSMPNGESLFSEPESRLRAKHVTYNLCMYNFPCHISLSWVIYCWNYLLFEQMFKNTPLTVFFSASLEILARQGKATGKREIIVLLEGPPLSHTRHKYLQMKHIPHKWSTV